MNTHSAPDSADLAALADIDTRIGPATPVRVSELMRARLEILNRLFGRLTGDQIDALPAGSVILAGTDAYQAVAELDHKEFRWCRADQPAFHNTYELLDRYDEIRLVITGPELDELNS